MAQMVRVAGGLHASILTVSLCACGYIDYDVVVVEDESAADATVLPTAGQEADGSASPSESSGEQSLAVPLNVPALSQQARLLGNKLAVVNAATCVLSPTSTMHCWGSSAFGVLLRPGQGNWGDNAGETAENAAISDLGSGFVPVRLIGDSAECCAIAADGASKCWGANNHGELGLGHADRIGDDIGEDGDGLPFSDMGSSDQARVITMGQDHRCALNFDDELRCWGQGASGRLGQESENNLGDDGDEIGADIPPIALGTGVVVQEVAVGSAATCVITDSRAVKCWGSNLEGALGAGAGVGTLGDDPGDMGDAVPFVDLGFDTPVLELSMGSDHACALSEAGVVKCWGRNDEGQLGLGDTLNRGDDDNEMGAQLPSVDLGTDPSSGEPLRALHVEAKGKSSCALLETSQLKCWGEGSGGVLGQGSIESIGRAPGQMGDNLPPIDLGDFEVAAFSLGYTHACAISTTGTLKCWGVNTHGRLGRGPGNNAGTAPGQMGSALPVTPLPFAIEL